MKKQTKTILMIIAALVLLVGVIAVVYAASRERVPEGALAVRSGDKTEYVELSKQKLEPVAGSLVNGKGQKIAVDAKGMELADVLRAAGVKPEDVASVTVTADDAFSAEVTGEEMLESGKAYLTYDADEGMTLVVFGDSNAKRNVRSVVSVDVKD